MPIITPQVVSDNQSSPISIITPQVVSDFRNDVLEHRSANRNAGLLRFVLRRDARCIIG